VQTSDKLSAVLRVAAEAGDLLAVYEAGEAEGVITRRALFEGIQSAPGAE
jgi:hypothetical protein